MYNIVMAGLARASPAPGGPHGGDPNAPGNFNAKSCFANLDHAQAESVFKAIAGKRKGISVAAFVKAAEKIGGKFAASKINPGLWDQISQTAMGICFGAKDRASMEKIMHEGKAKCRFSKKRFEVPIRRGLETVNKEQHCNSKDGKINF